MTSLREKLASECDVVTWPPLRLHAKRQGLFFVDDPLVLLDVALAVAENRTAEVEAWIASGRLRRPTADEISRFEAAPEAFSFRTVIVQPFVLAKREGLS